MTSDRFVKVPEQLIARLARMRLSGTQAAIVAALIGNLYRWPEVRDRLSSRYLAGATGLDRRTVRRALAQLVGLGLLTIGGTRQGSRPGRIAFTASAEVGALPAPSSGRPGAPSPMQPAAPVVGALVRPEVGAVRRHKVRERELQSRSEQALALEQIARDELRHLEAQPPSEFRTVRILKVQSRLDAKREQG